MSRRDCVSLLVIALAGALLRFLTLDHQSYDHDEAVTVGRVLHASFGATMHVVSDGERSPPLYYVLAWLWSKVFGTGEVGLRALSALIGTLLIPVAYFAARRFGSGRAGVLAAAFVALNPYLIWYSQEARSYGLLVLLSGIGLLFFAKALERGSRRDLLLWSVASALAVCSHYFAVFLIAPQAIWLLYARRRDRRVMAAVAAIVVVGLALLPLALHQEGLGRSNHFTNVPLATRAIEVPTKYFTSEEPGWLIGSRSVDAVQIAALICGSALLGFALWLGLRQGDRRERRGMAVYGVVALAAFAVPLLAAVGGADFVDPRNLIGSLFPLLLVVAIGVSVRRSLLGALAAGAACLFFVGVNGAVYESAQMQRPDWRSAAEASGSPTGPRIMVVPRNGSEPMAYYLSAGKLSNRTEPKDGVGEIDVYSKAIRIKPPPKPFTMVREQGLAPLLILRVFRAPRPVYVRPLSVENRRILTERSTALVSPGP